jgi:hypothetical protein
MMIIRSAQVQGTGTALGGTPGCMPDADPLSAQAVQAFAGELAAGRVPSVRVIRARLHEGWPRPRRLPAYLAALNGAQGACPSNIRLPYPRFRWLPDGTPDGKREISPDLRGHEMWTSTH